MAWMTRILGCTVTRRTLFLVLLTALVGGCASPREHVCRLHEQRIQTLDQGTHYLFLTAEVGDARLNKNTPAAALSYRLNPGVERIPPCNILTLRKELSLKRADDPKLLFKETREFYAEDGTLITSVTEDLTSQLARSGRYQADIPLPIPRVAPPGRYRVVTRLNLERLGDKRILPLAASEAWFQIVPPPQPKPAPPRRRRP